MKASIKDAIVEAIVRAHELSLDRVERLARESAKSEAQRDHAREELRSVREAYEAMRRTT